MRAALSSEGETDPNRLTKGALWRPTQNDTASARAISKVNIEVKRPISRGAALPRDASATPKMLMIVVASKYRDSHPS